MTAQPPTCLDETRHVPTFIRERFTDLAQKVRYRELRTRIWTRLLKEDERQRVMQSDVQGSMVQIWSWAKNVSLDRAVIDLARKLGFLLLDEDQQLLEYIEPQEQVAAAPAVDTRPSYRNGELWLGENLICELRRRAGSKTKKEILFEAFEDAGWPEVIASPFRKKDQAYVYKAVQDANDAVGLCFHSACSGTKIWWEIVDPNGTDCAP